MNTNVSRWESVLLLTCRFIAGGAFLIAPFMKLQDPKSFMLSIKSFELLPEAIIPFMAYLVPWMELAAGVLLIYGLWSRAAALVAGGLYLVFTAALLYVIFSGLPVDCGCFAGLFGSGEVGWNSIGRNSVFVVTSLLVLARGGGAISVDAVFSGSRDEVEHTVPKEVPATALAGQPS